MTGLELSKEYFEAYGRPMLNNDFTDLLPYLCVGFAGKGSDRFGFDDEISTDHDFEPGFCIFLPGEDVVDRRQAFLLERAYAKLPSEFMGYKRGRLSPVGGNRNGVIRTADFYNSLVFSADGRLSINDWLNIPEFILAEATNGEIFFDNFGEFTKIRNTLANMPSDIKIKRISKNLLAMGQCGQYNHKRCLLHGEKDAAQLCCYNFVKLAMSTIFLLNNKYMPFYKWSFKALRLLPEGENFSEKLSFLINENNESKNSELKEKIINEIAFEIVKMLIGQGFSDDESVSLEKQAYIVNGAIKDGNIRNYPI